MKEHLKLLFIAAIMLIVVGVSNTNAQTYSGQAYAAGVSVNVVGQPLVRTNLLDTGDLPAAGGNVTLSSVGITVLPANIVSVGDATTSSSAGPLGGTPNSSQSLASVNSLNVGALGIADLVTAGLITSSTSCTCPGEVRLGDSDVANLVVFGTPIVVDGSPNQTVVVNIGPSQVLTVVINEQILGPRSVTVNALHITVAAPLLNTTIDVVVASARSGINCLIAPLDDLYSGRGTGVRLSQNSLLTPFLTTIVSDTGWLPSSGGSISTTTTGAGLAPILSTGVVTSHTEGGLPVNTSESSSQVDDLIVDIDVPTILGPLDVLEIAADVITSDTQCQCSTGIPVCTGDSDLVGLNVTALGIPISIPLDFPPNFELVNLPLPLGLGNLLVVVNEQISAGPGDITVNALHIQVALLDDLLVDTDLVVAHAHSDIVCGLGPSAGTASISGQVMDVFGRAIPRVSVVVTDLEGRAVPGRTNNFGYYRVEDLRVGETYIVLAYAKGYEFEPITVSLSDDLTGVDFIPSSQPSLQKE